MDVYRSNSVTSLSPTSSLAPLCNHGNNGVRISHVKRRRSWSNTISASRNVKGHHQHLPSTHLRIVNVGTDSASLAFRRHSRSSTASSIPTLKDQYYVISAINMTDICDSAQASNQESWETINLTPLSPSPLLAQNEMEPPASPNYLMQYQFKDNNMIKDADDDVDSNKSNALIRMRASANTVIDVASIMIGVNNAIIRIGDDLKDDDAATLLDEPLVGFP